MDRQSGGPGNKPGGGTAPTTLQAGLDKVNKMISGGRAAGFTQAAANLEQWRDRKGDRVMPASAFQTQKFLLDHLAGTHRAKFIEGAKKRLADGRVKPGQTFTMEWTDSTYAPVMTDLFFALGGFTVKSGVTAVVAEKPGGRELQFQVWRVEISDTYNWDPGKSTPIPGIGRITDDEMLALEKAGYGKAFNVRSEPFRPVDPRIIGPAAL